MPRMELWGGGTARRSVMFRAGRLSVAPAPAMLRVPRSAEFEWLALHTLSGGTAMLPNGPVDTRPEDQLRRACAELDRCLRAGQPCSAEGLLAAYPALAADADTAVELIYAEFVTREALGQRPASAEWCARFPQWQEPLAKLFQ